MQGSPALKAIWPEVLTLIQGGDLEEVFEGPCYQKCCYKGHVEKITDQSAGKGASSWVHRWIFEDLNSVRHGQQLPTANCNHHVPSHHLHSELFYSATNVEGGLQLLAVG